MNTLAQEKTPRGYVSTSGGVAFKLNGNQPTGFQYSFVEFGYEIARRFGVVASWAGNTFKYTSIRTINSGASTIEIAMNVREGTSQFMAGPMYIIPVNEKLSVDLKARVGYYSFTERDTYYNTSIATSSSDTYGTFGYHFTAACQYRISQDWTTFGSMDYTNNQANFSMSADHSISTLAVAVGIGFRL